MSIEHLLNTSADFKRPVASYDDMGSVQYTLTTIGSSVACRISSSVPSEISNGPTEYADATAMVYTLPGHDFKRDDEVHHGSTVYRVLGTAIPSVSDHHLRLVCEVLQDG